MKKHIISLCFGLLLLLTFAGCNLADIVPETCAHQYGDAQTVRNPDCTHTGLRGKVCEKCGCVYELTMETIPALGHSFVDNTCERCGEIENKLIFKTIGDFELNETDFAYPTLTLTVPKTKSAISLDASIAVYDGCSYTVSKDPEGAEPIAAKNIPLEYGHNTVYITLCAGGDNRVYLADIYRFEEYTYSYISHGKVLDSGFAAKDTVLERPADLSEEGYVFRGWTVNGEDAVFPFTLADDVVFTANWEAITYSVTYDLKNGENAESNPETYTADDAIALLNPTRSGYTFVGWSEGNTIAKGSTGNKTFTANWAPTPFTVTYELGGGVNDPSNPKTYTVEDATLTLACPTRPGYTFAGWSDGGIVPEGSTGNKTFTASWEIVTYSVTYDLGGGENAESNPATYTVEDALTLTPPTCPGYTFVGWSEGNTIAKGSTGDKTFTANWVPTPYTITYQLSGGTNHASNPGTYTVEDATLTLAAPTRRGYTFTGWSDGGIVQEGSTGNKTFTASWEIITYSVTYDLNDGENAGSNPATYTVEDALTLTPPTRPGYTFVGWSEGDTIAKGNTGDKTFTANWVPTPYTITYQLGGGTNHASNPGTYTVEDATLTLANPTRRGYTFTGWTDGGTVPEGSTGNKIFTALWMPVSYTVTYVLGGGTNASRNPATYTVEDAVTLTQPTRPGYTFAGWSDGGTITKGNTGDKTFTAFWTPISYTVMYQLNGGTNAVSNPDTYTIEDALTLADPTRTGYTFTGWTEGNTIEKGSTENKTFTATWKVNSYTISYVMNGGTNISLNPATYTVEYAVSLADPTRTGYTFAGWTEGNAIAKGSTGNKTFTANWTAIPYTVTYQLNGGTNDALNPGSYTVEDAVTLAAPTRTGYTFTGWTNDGVIAAGSTGNKTFTAKWEIITYSVVYVMNDGTNAVTNPETYTVEDAVSLADPTRTGYTFTGWTEGNAIAKGSTGNKTFTANFTAIPYTVTYQLNGGTNDALNPVSYTVEDALTLANPTRTGYTFTGWTNDGVIAAGSTGNKTFTAGWEPDTYTITYVLDGGTNAAMNPATYTIASSAITLVKPQKIDYSFKGWYCDEDLTQAATPIAKGSTGDRIFYAKWEYGTEGLLYALSSGSYTVTGYAGTATAVVIPDRHLGAAVTAIGNSAFYGGNTLTSITVGDNVTKIGDNAFAGCGSLTEINVPDGVLAIGVNAFDGCNSLVYNEYDNAYYLGNDINAYAVLIRAKSTTVTACTIHANTKYMYRNAFSGCAALMSIAIPDGVTSIEDSTFSDCTALANVAIPYSVTSIGVGAFRNCSSLTHIAIPDSVTSIGEGAFSGCSKLKSMTIPFVSAKAGDTASNTYLLTSDTYQSADSTSSLEDSTYRYPLGYIFGKSSYTGGVKTTQVYYDSSTGGTTFPTYYIPSTLTSVTVAGDYIPNGAFYNCSSLTSINIPDSVTSIDSNAFSGCTGLTAVYITDIEAWYKIAFGSYTANPLYYAHNLYLNNELVTDLVIPDSVTSIGKYAFSGCSSSSITISSSVTSIGEYAFYNCEHLTSITIPDSVTSIGEHAFSGCSSFTSITIPDSVTRIGSSAFNGCSKLKSMTIPFVGAAADGNKDTHFGYIFGAVSDSNNKSYVPSSLKNVVITKATSIGASAFYSCSSLTSIEIPDSVTSIGYGAFRNCSSLTRITIPDSVTSIGYGAFEDCDSLTAIYITDIAAWCRIAFGDYSANPLYYAHKLYLNNELVTDLVIPSSVTSIGNRAFNGWSSLTRITIPDSVTSIGGFTFYYCSSLTSVTYTGTKAQWTAISKGTSWNYNTGTYTIHCKDGDLTK